jgi:hypothetical protein
MTRQETPKAAASARPRRPNLGKRNRLAIRDKEPGYDYRIVNANLENDPERVQDLIDEGWEIVPKKITGQIGDSKVDNPSALGSAGLISVGQGTKAVTMRIKSDWREEDQKAKQAQLDELEATMKKTNSDYGKLNLNARTSE